MCYIVFISRIQRPLRPASVFSMMMMMMMMSLVYSLSFSFSHTLSTVSRYYHATVPPDVVSMSAINDQMSAMVGDRMLAGQHLVRHCLKHFFVLDVGLNCGVLCGHG